VCIAAVVPVLCDHSYVIIIYKLRSVLPIVIQQSTLAAGALGLQAWISEAFVAIV
jgi:hypothetical protein